MGKYTQYEKPLKSNSGGLCYDGNMMFDEDKRYDYNRLFRAGNTESFNGFSGTSEFESFPLRQLFLNNHKKFPCEWDTGYIKSIDVQKYVLENKKHVIASHYTQNGKDVSKCILYLGGKECIYVYLYNRSWEEEFFNYGVCLLFRHKSKRVDSIINYFIKLVIPPKKEEKGLNILVKTSDGYDLYKKEITCPDINFELNYNDDFKPTHDLIINKLSIDKSKGLVLLHGKAGTGKTSYIRYLINKLEKKVIYIPPNMTNSLADPELIKFFIKNSNSILVIEDAENVLMKRAANSTQAIANILNLSDGLLSDCTNIQIIATFNTDILNIDSALLRKGRLIAKYEFKELEPEITEKLSKKLGFNIKGRHTLADIYNASDKSFSSNREKVGF